MPTAKDRRVSALAHLSAWPSSFTTLPFLCPLIFWAAARKGNSYRAQEARSAVNFNMSFAIYFWTFVVLGVVGRGMGGNVIVLFVIGISDLLVSLIWIIATIQAAIHAGRGKGSNYPLAFKFLK